MKVTFNHSPITLEGNPVQVGQKLPDFTLTSQSLTPVHTSDTHGLRVFVVVPSLDTQVCDMEVRNFNEKASNFANTTIYAVSMDLPFAQARWCGGAGIDKVVTLSDYHHHSFGKATGTYIQELGLLTRAVFIVDQSNTVVYVEYVPEVTNHPDYDKIYKKLEELTK